MGLLLLICKLFKDIVGIKKQFSLATQPLTLKILQDHLFNPFLGADHILKHNVEAIGKAESGTWKKEI